MIKMRVNCIAFMISVLICSHHSYLIRNTDTDNHLAESESVLDPSGELLLKWRVDYSARRIQFQISLSDKAPPSSWFAVGFSDRGELENADVCLLWTDYKGNDHFEDMHSDKSGNLFRDDKQHCEGFHLDSKSRSAMFERDFDTCDPDDYVIEDGTVHIVWARGVDKLFSSRGLCLPCTTPQNHGFIRVRLLTPPGHRKVDGHELRFTNKNLKVPNDDTTYWCKVIKLPDYITQTSHHIIQFQSTITRGNEGLVHHMELFYCDTDPKTDIPLYEGNCFAPDRPEITKTCSKVKSAWAMGAPPFTYPEEAGLPLGGPKQNKYVMLEVHYNNPEMKKAKSNTEWEIVNPFYNLMVGFMVLQNTAIYGIQWAEINWVDSSGIVVYMTANKRRYDAAIMELGLEYTDKMAIPAGQKAFPLSGYCIPQCTGVGLPEHGIVVFGSQLHTHLTGAAVWTRHSRRGVELPMLNRDEHYSTHFQEIRILHRPVRILPLHTHLTGAAVWTRHSRRGVELPMLNRDEHYSTHFQEIRILHRPVRILPGDYLETTCIFKTDDRTNATIGGHAITDEMCVNYLHYYPATELEVCKSAVANVALENYFKFEKLWDNMDISYTSPPRANYLAIHPWTPLRVKSLHALYTESPISMQCNKSDGNRFQGDWEGLPIPKIRVPLPPAPRLCPNGHDKAY